MELNLVYVDKYELVSVLNALIKQELYKFSNSDQSRDIEVTKSHINAEITKIEKLKEGLKHLLYALQSAYESKNQTYNATSILKEYDVDTTTSNDYMSIDDDTIDYIAKLKVCIENVIKNIIYDSRFNMDIIEDLLDPIDSGYIDALIEWCETPIKMDLHL